MKVHLKKLGGKMKTISWLFLLSLLIGITIPVFSKDDQIQKNFIKSIEYDSTILEKSSSPDYNRFLPGELEMIVRGDTFVYTPSQKIIVRDVFPYSTIDYVEEQIQRSYLSSNKKIIRATFTKSLYDRTGEDVFPSFPSLLWSSLIFVLFAFLFSLFRFAKYSERDFILKFSPSLMAIFSCMGMSVLIIGYTSLIKLNLLLMSFYGLIIFITNRLGKLYLRRIIKREEQNLQKA